MTAYEVRSYAGNAADTVLNANIGSTALTFSVAPGTGAGYPDGTQGPFYVFIDYDTSAIEKVRCTGRINDTFTVPDTGSRGVDGTTAQSHTANAKVRHGWTATDAQEANRAAANTVGKVTTKGDLLAATGANTLARVAAGADGRFPVADSTKTAGLRYPTGAHVDASDYLLGPNDVKTTVATVTGLIGGTTALAAGTQQSYYKRIGDLVWFTWVYEWGVGGQSAMPNNLQVNNVPVACALGRAVGRWNHTNGASGDAFMLGAGTTLFLSGTSGVGAGPSEYIVAQLFYFADTVG